MRVREKQHRQAGNHELEFVFQKHVDSQLQSWECWCAFKTKGAATLSKEAHFEVANDDSKTNLSIIISGAVLIVVSCHLPLVNGFICPSPPRQGGIIIPPGRWGGKVPSHIAATGRQEGKSREP